MFPFARFPGVDTVLGPEMRSTGEVMGLDWRRPGEDLSAAFARAFAKSQLGGGTRIPTEGCVFVSVKDADKPWILEPVRLLSGYGFKIIATSAAPAPGLRENGIDADAGASKVLEGRPHIVDAMKNGEVQLVFNTTDGQTVPARQLFAAPHGPDDEDSLLHDDRRRARRLASHRGGARGIARGQGVAELRLVLADIVVALRTVVPAGGQATALETTSRSRRDIGRCDRASRPAPRPRARCERRV